MIDFKIVENFFNKEDFLFLQSIITHSEFPWYFKDNISSSNTTNSFLGDFGFGHCFFLDKPNSSAYSLIEPYVKKICDFSETKRIIKVRADMTVYSMNEHQHVVHRDLMHPHIVSILYLTNSNAKTVLYEDELAQKIYKVILPKKNQLLVFDGKYYHTGHSPSDSNRRILLNINSI